MQALGPPVSTTPAALPSNERPLVGQYARLEGLRKEHIPGLFAHFDLPHDTSVFGWLPWLGPTDTEEQLWEILESLRKDRHFVLYAVVADPYNLNRPLDPSSTELKALGTIGYSDISISNRTLETAAVLFAPVLRRSIAATEAHYLLLRNVCDQNGQADVAPYRRVAWLCNHLNVASREAAERIGYVYEGTLRKHMIARGRNRDSTYSRAIHPAGNKAMSIKSCANRIPFYCQAIALASWTTNGP